MVMINLIGSNLKRFMFYCNLHSAAVRNIGGVKLISTMVSSKVWLLAKRPDGEPKLSDFKCINEELPACPDGGVVIEAKYLSVDPYMRYRARMMALDTVMPGSQVAKVIESHNSLFPVGCHLVAYPGWRTHSILSSEQLSSSDFNVWKIPESVGVPLSLSLGVLGMPGNTAYFGLLEICDPKAGETVLVNGGGGAVGSLVVQIAKIKGCKVIAFAGTDDKVAWMKELGADFAFNYKTANVYKSLKEAAPEGINCYFDNVGGKFSAEVLPRMAPFGRISLCGAISTYNNEAQSFGVVSMNSPFNEGTIIFNQLKLEGFIVSRWSDRWMEGIDQMMQWLQQGKLQYKEAFVEGFEKVPSAFIGLFHGDNLGKAIVTV